MRKADREVKDFEIIKDIIAECDSIKLAFNDGDYPYIVPLNFGVEYVDDQIIFYVHGAKVGKKVDLIEANGKCGFEMDCSHVIELIPENKDITMRYRSIIGKANIEILEDLGEKRHGLDVIMAGIKEAEGYEWNYDVVPHTMVAKLTVVEYAGKINPVRK